MMHSVSMAWTTSAAPVEAKAEQQAKSVARKERMLAMEVERKKNAPKTQSELRKIQKDNGTLSKAKAALDEQLDDAAVKKGLADFNNKLVNAKDDYEKAAAQIGIEVCGAMNHALEGK